MAAGSTGERQHRIGGQLPEGHPVRWEGVEESRVTIKALAAGLSVAPASVTNMLQKLAVSPAPLVEYERHGGVQLSAAGKRRALEVVRHHRLIETFLYEVLDYPLEEVHEEAERLEHFISERFEERIAAKLGHPKIDPHGHSIPTMEGEMAARESMLLADVVEDGTFVIDSVSDRDVESLGDGGLRDYARGAAAGEEERKLRWLFGQDWPLLQGLRSLPRGSAGHTDCPSGR
jgi:Mn-dependent DtxR family transcriptional regulator